MPNEVFGPYNSTDEAINMVATLGLKGYKSSNISLYAHEDYTEELIRNTDVNVESEAESEVNQPSFIKKVQNLFTNDANTHASLHEKLTEGNISDKQAEKFVEAIEDGEILIIADNELRMGNDTASNSITMQEDTIQRE